MSDKQNTITQYDWTQTLLRCYDENSDRLRVTGIIENTPVPFKFTSFLITYDSNDNISKIQYFNNLSIVVTLNYYYDTECRLVGFEQELPE